MANIEVVNLDVNQDTRRLALGWLIRSIAIYNMTPYVLYINYSGNIPTADSYDFLVSSLTSLSFPTPPTREISFFLDMDTPVVITHPACNISVSSGTDLMVQAQLQLSYPYTGNAQYIARTSADDWGSNAWVSPSTNQNVTYSAPADQLTILRQIFVNVHHSTANDDAIVSMFLNRNLSSPTFNKKYFDVFGSVAGVEKYTTPEKLIVLFPHWDIVINFANNSINSMYFSVICRMDRVPLTVP